MEIITYLIPHYRLVLMFTSKQMSFATQVETLPSLVLNQNSKELSGEECRLLTTGNTANETMTEPYPGFYNGQHVRLHY